MQHDHGGARDAEEAADLAQKVQAFPKEFRAQHRRHEHAQRSQRRHEGGGCEGVRGEISAFASGHEKEAAPPHPVLQVAVTSVA